MTDIQKQVDELRNRVQILTSQIAHQPRSSESVLSARLDSIESEVSELDSRLALTEAKLTDLESRVSQLEAPAS